MSALGRPDVDALTERAFLRLGAGFALVGAVVGFVADALHPTSIERYLEAQVRLVAGSASWLPVHVAILIAGVLVVGGLAAVARSISGPRGAALAWLALVVAVIGIAINAVEMATDGIGLKLAADAWAAAPAGDKPAAFYGAYAVSRIGGGLARAQVIVFFGGAVGLFGLAMALGSGYPRWLGVLGAAIGAGLAAHRHWSNAVVRRRSTRAAPGRGSAVDRFRLGAALEEGERALDLCSNAGGDHRHRRRFVRDGRGYFSGTDTASVNGAIVRARRSPGPTRSSRTALF